jgi:hypothetical protein
MLLSPRINLRQLQPYSWFKRHTPTPRLSHFASSRSRGNQTKLISIFTISGGTNLGQTATINAFYFHCARKTWNLFTCLFFSFLFFFSFRYVARHAVALRYGCEGCRMEVQSHATLRHTPREKKEPGYARSTWRGRH